MSDTCEVYRAEHMLRLPVWSEVIADPQAWVTHVTRDSVFLEMRRETDLPLEPVVIVPAAPQRQRACAWPKLQIIEIPVGYAPTQRTLLHEVVHLCTPDEAAHDVRFATNYVRLARFWLGDFAAREMLIALRSTKVLL